jgi:hypothetical protein
VVGVIYNRTGSFTSSIIEKSISSSATFPEDGVMFGFFGHEGDFYDTAHLDREAVKSGFALKEVRIWAASREKLDLIAEQRDVQIDPTLYINRNLISYYRLVAKREYGSSYDNFARHNLNGGWKFSEEG